MTAKNDITGDELKSKLGSKSYEEGWERIFGRNNKGEQRPDANDDLRVPQPTSTGQDEKPDSTSRG